MPIISGNQAILAQQKLTWFRYEQHANTNLGSIAARSNAASPMTTQLLPVLLFTLVGPAVTCAVIAFSGAELATWAFPAE
jgi:hypothetical protein